MKNRKLFISILTGLCACLMSATLFTACGETHTHSYTSQTTTEATCREKGLTTYTCSCGDTYTEEILALGHDTKTHEAQAPTCTEKGWSEYVTCEREGCDYSTYEEILALKHDIVNHEAQAPTCAEIGWETYETCQREGCDYTTYEEIPATGNHTWNDGEITTEPTCTETGVKTFTCTVCETATKTENVNALMHDIKANDSKAPTCTEIGWNAYATCEREGCDYTTYEELPATGVHTWNDGEETTSPTCTEKGETTYTCTVCKTATKTEPIQTLPHDHAEEWTYDESNHWHECKCGDKTDEGEHIPSTPATATTPQTCTICGYVIQGETGIVFNTLTTNGNKVNGTVSNTTTEFSFLDEITVKGNAQFIVALDKNGMQTVITKKITLQEGDNTVYVFETLNGEITNTYTVTIRRRPMYNVTFNEKGGTTVANQSIEEGFLATEPETAKKGYTFVEWDYDFTTPITKDTEITALWKANENTKYIVNYYAQNIENDEYTLFSTEELTGTTDTTATATINQYEHFTYNEKLSTVKGNIDGDGSLVLSVYYTRDKYTIKTGYIIKYFDDYTASEITQTEIWKYGMELTCSVSTWEGYTWIGWYEDIGSDMAQLVTNEQSFAFIVDKNVTYYQCWQANTDTKYTVNYYLQNIDDDEYTLYETEELTGMTDTLATATIKEYEHFTYNENVSTVSGYIQGDGSLVLSVYYTRNTYTLSINDSLIGSITNAGMYKYGVEEFTSTATLYLGYAFLGWYNGEELLSTDLAYTFTAEKDVTATFEVKKEMLNFEFTSDVDTCSITGIKDKTVTEVIVPDYVNSISAGAFSGCSSLESITLPFVGAKAGVTENDTCQYPFGYIFGRSSYEGSAETTQYYYGYSTSSTTSSTYYIPTSLKKVTITAGIILYGSFSGCSNLTNVIIPDNIASIGDSAFSVCSSLTSIILPNSVTSIGKWAFSGCSSLRNISIPDSVTSIGSRVFEGCSSLTSITIPDSVTSIGEGAFAYCSGLTSVVIGENVTSIGNSAFAVCHKIVEVVNKSPHMTITEGDWDYGEIGAHALAVYNSGDAFESNLSNDNNYVIYTEETEKILVGYIGAETNLNLPAYITKINNYAFSDCTKLTSITIPNSVTSIGYHAFAYCGNLTNVIIGNSVTSIDFYAFAHCDSLTNITIPDNVTSIDGSAFEGCDSLTNIMVSENNIAYRSIEGNLYSKDGKTLIQYALGKKAAAFTIPDGVTSIGNGAFFWCDSLTSVTIPNSVTSIGAHAFNSCINLTSVDIGDGVTSIGFEAFGGCGNLISIILPDSLTSIGDWAFGNCSSLTSITIPDSVTFIGNYAFANCSSLTSITFEDTSTWYRTDSYGNYIDKSDGSQTNVERPTANATYFKSTYMDYYWYKL